MSDPISPISGDNFEPHILPTTPESSANFDDSYKQFKGRTQDFKGLILEAKNNPESIDSTAYLTETSDTVISLHDLAKNLEGAPADNQKEHVTILRKIITHNLKIKGGADTSFYRASIDFKQTPEKNSDLAHVMHLHAENPIATDTMLSELHGIYLSIND